MSSTRDRIFVDSNVLIYAHDLDAGDRHVRAVTIVRNLWENGNGVVSTQVLQEFYVNVTRKIPHALEKSLARELVRNYSSWQTESIDGADIFRASLSAQPFNTFGKRTKTYANRPRVSRFGR